ncbi:tape measure protein [Stakelama pacifica]|uniref:Tape measure domain-containing protein n=1 Tax=Stakelama pacifica TaxID=517720 RepID=A0A4R6FLI1_9SPHN|nr:tape measure protein [Stakelama pacifica]TDN81790.1 tape measure domain-containing protein [Stakelama pacifica]GGO96577.1 hypothetical protein GCM10011329_23430 [Stakelama pacifica]
MAEVDPVILELRAENAKFKAELRSTARMVDSSVTDMDRRFRRLEDTVDRSGARMVGGLNSIKRAAIGLFAGISTIALAREFLRLTDASKQLEAQLRLATRESGNFGQAQRDVERIAQETRNGLEETAQLYATFQRNAVQLGITQEQAARATETVTKSFQISGASAEEAAGGLRQFLQGLQSGTLRGEELNSVLENAPRLAKLLADSLNVTIGQLRAMGAAGELSADKLIKALTERRYTDQIDSEFKELPVTFDQAMTQVRNAAIVTFGAFDRGGEFSSMLASFFSDGSEGFASLADSAEQAGIDIRAAFEGLASVFEPMVAAAQSAFGQINQNAQSSAEYVFGLFDTIDTIRNAPFVAAKSIQGGLKQAGVSLPDSVFVPGDYQSSQFGKRFRDAFKKSQSRGQTKAAERAIEAATSGNPLFSADFIASGGKLPPPPRPVAVSSTGTGGKKKRGPSAETIAKREEAARRAALRDDLQFEDEKRAANIDLLRAKQAVAVAADTIADYERDQIEAERQRRNASYDAAVKMGELTEARAEELKTVNDQIAAQDQLLINLREADRRQKEALDIAAADRENTMEIAQVQASIADTVQKRRDAALRLLDLELEQERARQEGIIASRTATEAEKEIARRRLEALGGIAAARTEAINQQYAGPLERYRQSMRDPRTQVEDAVVQQLESVNRGITDAITKKIGVKDPLLESLLDIFIQQTILRPFMDALSGASQQKSGIGGFFGGLVSSISSIFGGSSKAGFTQGPAARTTPGIGDSLARFANGGSMMIGGNGGMDQNVLSLNGKPVARVSRGETLNVVPNARASRNTGAMVISAPQFNLRGAVVTAELYADMQRISNESAERAGKASYRQSMKDVGTALQHKQKYGTSRF